MPHFLGYRCSLCGAEYAPAEIEYVCPAHGADGNVDVQLDYAALGRAVSPPALAATRDFSLWRYLPLLPVADPGCQGTPLRSAGWTPLYRADRLAAPLGLKRLFIKDDGRNPTASFKDRASAVAVARARAIGAQTIATASSGNAAAALAAMAASVGMPAVIFVPRTAPPAKVAQLLMFGARVFLVNGTYSEAFDLTLAACREFGWHCRNTGYNPFTLEGKKTAAYEICEQLTGLEPPAAAGWRAPDRVFVSVGDGNIISGLHKGFKDLLALGWIEQMPKLMGVQAAGAAAVAAAWQSGAATVAPAAAQTLADSICVDRPRDGVRAVRAARETGGAYLTVTETEILQAMRALGHTAAVFAEPAGAVGYAGLVKAAQAGQMGADERVVVVVTGNGLKDTAAALKATGPAVQIEPDLASVKRAWPGA